MYYYEILRFFCNLSCNIWLGTQVKKRMKIFQKINLKMLMHTLKRWLCPKNETMSMKNIRLPADLKLMLLYFNVYSFNVLSLSFSFFFLLQLKPFRFRTLKCVTREEMLLASWNKEESHLKFCQVSSLKF